MNKPLVTRYQGNPILTKDDIPYPVQTVHNAGVTKFDDKYIMLFRSHLDTGRCIIGLAESEDGFNFKARPKPFMTPSREPVFAEYEVFGVEDPRITYLEGTYYITYSAYSQHGVRIGLAKTQDFESVERVSLITQADYRNTVLFPEKIDGRYVKLDRPHSDISPWSIWISYSPDLRHWGDSRLVMKPVPYHWDETKIGPGAPPIRTYKGWLSIYHGVFPTMAGHVYRRRPLDPAAGRPVGNHRLRPQRSLHMWRCIRGRWYIEVILGWSRQSNVRRHRSHRRACGIVPDRFSACDIIRTKSRNLF